jgi:cell division protein FtsZ
MRLMEVDEAASHIKELVDPDANIIWGSAFNNNMEGRIRVSVVATGIEADTGIVAQPGKVFSFPTTRATGAAAPAAPPPPVAVVEDSAPLDLGTETDDSTDELLLDSDDILTSPVGSAPIAPPADDEIDPTEPTAAMAGDEPTSPRVARETGTLFERMSNIARGAAKAQVDEDDAEPGLRREPIDIPRFLNRQNNQ